MKRNVKLVIQYDGSQFSGWQAQNGARTIQGELTASLFTILSESVTIVSAARTDAGVHAWGSVCNFTTRSAMSVSTLQRAINSKYRNELSVRSVSEVPLSFHSRHCATSRLYRYTLLNSRYPEIFLRKYATWVRQPLDLDLMRDSVKELVGEHDFSSFRSSHCQAVKPTRTIYSAWIDRRGPFIHCYFRANSFLQQMIRILMGTILMVGIGTMTVDRFLEIRQMKDRRVAGPTVSPTGLCLVDVTYGSIPRLGYLPDPPSWF